MRRPVQFGLVFVLLFQYVFASDKQRELEYAAAIERGSSNGQQIWLQAGGQSFLSLYSEAEKTGNDNVALILHDRGDHPDHQLLIQSLRTVLPRHRWATLALQMPIRESGANEEDYLPLFDEARARIEAAVDYLRSNGAGTIAIVGYGLGATMAIYHLNAKPDNVAALVAISLPMPETSRPELQVATFLKNTALPILDVYAEFDLPGVVDTAQQRRLISKDNPVYRQLRIDGDNHAYLHDPALMVKRVYSWLTLATAS